MRIKLLFITTLLLIVQSCTIPTKHERDPADTGYDANKLKESRCACTRVYENGNWVI